MEELLDSTSTENLLSSFHSLFRIPVRLIAESGTSVARCGAEPDLHRLLGQTKEGSRKLGEFFEDLKRRDLGESGESLQKSFSGACYHVVAIGHGGSRVGRAVLGPFLDSKPEWKEDSGEPASAASRAELMEALGKLPQVNPSTVRSIGRHLVVALGIVLHESHRALMAARMHLASIQEGQREMLRQEHLTSVQLEKQQDSFTADLHQLAQVCSALGVALTGVASRSAQPPRGRAPSEVLDRARYLHSGLTELIYTFSGDAAPRKETVQCDSCLAPLREEASSANTELSARLEPSLPLLLVDPAQVQRALVLLVRRGLRATPRGGALSVEVTRSRAVERESDVGALLFLGNDQEAEVEWRLSRRGPTSTDIAAARQVFAPDFGADNPRGAVEVELMIARRLIEAQAGRTEVLDAGSEGWSFLVRLPALALGNL